MSAKSARTDPGRHDRSGLCGFALNVGPEQFDQLGNERTAHAAASCADAQRALRGWRARLVQA